MYLPVNLSPTVSIPQRIHSINKEYTKHMEMLNQAHDLWQQATTQAKQFKGMWPYQLLKWSRKLFHRCWTKCLAGLQRSARHFELLSEIFSSWWLANISAHSCFPCQTFYVYWTQLERSELSAGHQQKFAWNVWHISRSLLYQQFLVLRDKPLNCQWLSLIP